MTTPINESDLDALLRVGRLAPPEECRAGILANLALLAQHSAILRQIDDPFADPAELIVP